MHIFYKDLLCSYCVNNTILIADFNNIQHREYGNCINFLNNSRLISKQLVLVTQNNDLTADMSRASFRDNEEKQTYAIYNITQTQHIADCLGYISQTVSLYKIII